MSASSYLSLLKAKTSWASLSSRSFSEEKLNPSRNDDSARKLRDWDTVQFSNGSPGRFLSFPFSQPTGSFGRPKKKQRFEILDIIALLCSKICLFVGILVVSPHVRIAYLLGYNNQLIFIGFLLSVQTICLKRIMPTLWLLIEARFGKSTLQNYEAILRNQIIEPKIDWIWRIVMLGFIALPIGLSAAYKNFHGGMSSMAIKDHGSSQYGLTGLPGRDPESNFTLALTRMVGNPILYAMLPIIVAKASGEVAPPGENGPVQPYGFNTLLLSNSSVAFLDAPSHEYVTSIQNGLQHDEIWMLSATVNATVTRYNYSIAANRYDRSFWNSLRPSNPITENTTLSDDRKLTLYHPNGTWNQYPGSPVAPWFIVSNYAHNSSSEDNQQFFTHAAMFGTTREACDAVWRITSNSMSLQNGSCSGGLTDQTLFTYTTSPSRVVFKQAIHWTLTELPAGSPAIDESWHGVPWKLPMYTATVGAMWWSHLVGSNGATNKTPFYTVEDQVISTRSTIQASPGLYVVLATQPALLLAAFALQVLLYTTPLNHGFGLIAILAGVDAGSLHVLRGASLSGKLKKKVRLRIGVQNGPGEDLYPGSRTGTIRQVQYFVGEEGRNGTLRGTDPYH